MARRSPRLELEAIANAMRKTMKAYRLKEFDILIAVADPANDIDFIKDISFYIIHLIFVICFVSLYIIYNIYSTLFLGK